MWTYSFWNISFLFFSLDQKKNFFYIYTYIVFKSVCRLEYSKIQKKRTFCLGHFSSENYVSDNRVYIGESKHGILSIKRPGEGIDIKEKELVWVMFSSRCPMGLLKGNHFWIHIYSLCFIIWYQEFLVNVIGFK